MTAVPTVGPLPAPPRVCTGLTARWCPVHGDCNCPQDRFDDRDMDGLGNCPLHRMESTHAERITR